MRYKGPNGSLYKALVRTRREVERPWRVGELYKSIRRKGLFMISTSRDGVFHSSSTALLTQCGNCAYNPLTHSRLEGRPWRRCPEAKGIETLRFGLWHAASGTVAEVPRSEGD